MSDAAIENALRQPPAGPVHLLPFVPGGYGGYDTTAAVLRALDAAGASVIEVGLPFSDPVADGPTIQAAYHEALAGGATVDGVIDAAGGAGAACPLVMMASYSLVRRRGDAAFCRRLAEAGFAGVLCPDLPPPEAEAFTGTAADAGLEAVLLVAPTTPPARRDAIGRLARGFVYYLSVAGTTGERDDLPPELAAGVADMRGRTDRPICVGFGISRPRHVASLRGVADGAIVGSAFVRRMAGTADMAAAACGTLARELIL